MGRRARRLRLWVALGVLVVAAAACGRVPLDGPGDSPEAPTTRGLHLSVDGLASRPDAPALQIAVHYTNGDSGLSPRKLGVSVNSGPPQVESFRVVASSDWGRVGLLVVTAGGFRAGASTIAFTAGDDPAPDLDWIEVVPELAPLQ